jgi:hypothetical protein
MRGFVFAVSSVVVMLIVPAFASVGCGGVYYSVTAQQAQTRLEQARVMGAETQAPYEYYFAREHLHQAQVEAAEASYSDAASYAETAELYAQKAIDQMQAAKRDGVTTAPANSPWSDTPDAPAAADHPAAPVAPASGAPK